MYYVYFFDYGNMENRCGVERLSGCIDEELKAKYQKVKDNLILMKEAFTDLDDAYDFILHLASHCVFYELTDGDGHMLYESEKCRQIKELSKELENYTRLVSAQIKANLILKEKRN